MSITAHAAAEIRSLLDRPLFDGQFDADVAPDRLVDEYVREIAEGGRDVHVADGGVLLVGRALVWDTEFFGLPCYRIEYLRLTDPEPQIRWVTGWLRSRGVRLCFLRAAVGDPARMALGSGPFRIMSTKLLMRGALTGDAADARVVTLASLSAGVAGEREQAIERAVAIATERFGVGRFFADPAIGRERATAIYASWVRESAQADPQRFFCLLNEARAVSGMALCRRVAHGNVAFGFLDLVASDGTIEHGGARLLSATAAALAGEGMGRWFANVDLGNTRAMRLYSRAGFAPYNAVDEYHAWLD